MEKQKLPNEQAVMILGLVSFVGCCCSSGLLGLILSGIGIYLANKDEKTFQANPDIYSMGSLNTWKIINYVSLAISVIVLIWAIYREVTGQADEDERRFMEMLKQFQ